MLPRVILRDQHTKLWKREEDEDNEEDEEEGRRFQEEDFLLRNETNVGI